MTTPGEFRADVIAQAVYQQALLLADVFGAVWKLVSDDSNSDDTRRRTLGVCVSRSVAWVRTLAKLNQQSDAIAVHAAARSLVETAMDAALLHADKSPDSALKLEAYEWEQRRTAANKYRDYVLRTRRPTPENQPLLDFLDSPRCAQVLRDRAVLWPKHRDAPPTWTGESAQQNARDADARSCTCWRPLGSFDQQYAELNSRLNWATHGSGAVAFRGAQDLHGSYAVAMREALFALGVVLQVTCCELPSIAKDPHVVEALARAVQHGAGAAST